MKRLHPISTQRAWVLTLSMTIYLVGCNNQQMAASNPFMSPDRVPPPATRTIAPGQAAPYYPGDPMPSAQAVPPGAPAVAQAPPITPIGTTMPSPVAAQPIAPQQIAPQQAVVAPTAQAPTTTSPQPLAFSNERNVAIPTDNEQLRFAVPPPPPAVQPQPLQLAAQQMPTAATNPTPAAAPASAEQVVPAAFNQPVPAPTANPDSNGPWRSPQIAAGNSQVAQAQYVQAQPGQPTMLTAQPVMQTMPVDMRSVPSPQAGTLQVAPQQPQFQQVPTQPQQYTTPPRMRFPSWTDPTTWFTPTPEQGAAATQPQPGQQLIGYMVPGANGQMQMVPLDQYQKMQAGATQQSSAAGADGFRPRTTTK